MNEQSKRNQMVRIDLDTLNFDSFERNFQTDIVCVSPVRTIIRREEEILLIRRVRKVEEIDAGLACPINTVSLRQQQEGRTTGQTADNEKKIFDPDRVIELQKLEPNRVVEPLPSVPQSGAGEQSNLTIPVVDLVVVIDTSSSMRDEAESLSQVAEAAIEAAKSSYPSDLRVAWFGIEGTWKGTRFDRTVRDYLIYQRNVSASVVRSRRRGELADAGAQEDGARVIEDISTHFDWRRGAARAIFYLGDEALEGGGQKTNQEDIEAANLAIQKARQAGVTVHTYFGTSKSKYQEGIAKEYALVSSETGGQAFTDKDAISGFTAVLEKVICGSRPGQTPTPEPEPASQRPKEPLTPEPESASQFVLNPGTVYVQNYVSGQLSKLYTLDLSTGKATLIGSIATEVSDIAFVGTQLYGLDQKDGGQTMQLIKIDPAVGKATIIGDVGFSVIGLAYNRYRNTLYATNAKQLIAIDVQTGAGTPVVTVAGQDYNCGEVVFDRSGKAYITLIGYDRKKLLATCDLDTGAVTTIGDIGFPNLSSMEFVGDVLYGVAGNFFNLGSDGQLIRINTSTGAGTLITMTDPVNCWAGISVYEAA